MLTKYLASLDGVVLTENQSLPGALRTVDVDNVHHFQQRKDTRVGGVLDRVDDQFVFPLEADQVFRIDNCSIIN
jgi:uncharacterized circularly permuted ATP-grasp superfamily protein